MPQNLPPKALMPSVLDRLLDPKSLGTSARPWYGVDQITCAVRRDLIALLNSRQTDQGLLEDYPQCRASLLTFGLPDFTALDANTAAERDAIGRRLEDVIRQFEPRLRDVRVTMASGGNSRVPTLHYLVEAMLNVESAPDVAFEVILELATGQYDVEARRA